MPHFLVGKIVRGEIMSEYFKALDPIAQHRYIANGSDNQLHVGQAGSYVLT